MPYGEEAFIGVGNRAVGHGYTYGDSTRQKFTGYERDEETNLDFSQARMHNYNHGRFTSPDEFFNDTQVGSPASWNLYTYVRNNPLKYVDSSGEEVRLVRIKDKDGNEVENIGEADRKTLLSWLNNVYGCDGCVTIEDNVIRLDTTTVDKDVLAKTKDLTDAINDKKHQIYLIGYNGNKNVNFAEAGKNALNGNDAILVDFKDFSRLTGDKEAIASLSNYTLVHEIFHLYPNGGLEDTVSGKDKTGPVVNKINEIRQVRGAMLRAAYTGTANSSFGSMWFGHAKINKKTKQIKRNKKGGILVKSKKIISWNLRLTGN